MYRIRDVIDMAMKGIPEKYRAEIWMIYSGIVSSVFQVDLSLCISGMNRINQLYTYSMSCITMFTYCSDN